MVKPVWQMSATIDEPDILSTAESEPPNPRTLQLDTSGHPPEKRATTTTPLDSRGGLFRPKSTTTGPTNETSPKVGASSIVKIGRAHV